MPAMSLKLVISAVYVMQQRCARGWPAAPAQPMATSAWSVFASPGSSNSVFLDPEDIPAQGDPRQTPVDVLLPELADHPRPAEF